MSYEIVGQYGTPDVFNGDNKGVLHTLDSIDTVACSKQVYIELVVHCLLPILPGQRADTYRYKETLSVEALSRTI